MGQYRLRGFVVALFACVASACASSGIALVAVPTAVPTPLDEVPEPTPTAQPSPTPTVEAIRAPNGRSAPPVPADPAVLAEQLALAEAGLRDDTLSTREMAELGHLQQVLYRKLAREPSWDATVLPLMPESFRRVVELQVEGRRALTGLATGFDTADFVPAWAVLDPEPATDLLAYYVEAEALTGIEWEYLAAINLLETGFGRIVGLSGSGAQGPMQFLPTTWEEVGEGSIDDPHDAIVGAARYLVRRGGPADMNSAVLGYNNSEQYLGSVSAYAELLRVDPSAFNGLYNWEIYFFTDAGDVWLPVGYRSEVSIDVTAYLADAPWSEPDLTMLGSAG